jgi:hypothetical protein
MGRSEIARVLLLASLATGAVLGTSAPAVASARSFSCGSVSYTVPGTHGEGHAALNNITATGATCSTARTVAKAFVRDHKLPSGWHAKAKTVVSHGNTLGEEIFTRGSARVVGDVAN